MKRTALLLALLLPLLLCTLGFTRGSQADKGEVLQKASFIPKLAKYYSKPTVETTASYDGERDVWRVVLTEEQMRGLGGNVLLTEELYQRLGDTIRRTYPETVSAADLAEVAFLKKCRTATAEVYAALGLGRLAVEVER